MFFFVFFLPIKQFLFYFNFQLFYLFKTQYILQGRTTPLTSRAMVAQSCVDLMDADSPRFGGHRTFPKKFNFSQESPRKEVSGAENRDPDFRTPNLCSRPSFREKFRSRAGTLGGFSRKSSAN